MLPALAAASSRAEFPVQSVGDRGSDVLALQHILRARGHAPPTDGYFGSATRSALIDFQAATGLPDKGIADVATWERLVPTLRSGETGDAVTALKQLLNAKRRAGLSATDALDAPTVAAVREFQRHAGLPTSGVADLATWRNLVWHYERPDFSHPSLCNYNGGNYTADWGTASAIGTIEAAAALFHERTGLALGVGDVSFERGGPIVLHKTHEVGLDIDITAIRRDGRHCRLPGVEHTSARYDRERTRALIEAVREVGGPHVKLIYFNDPVLVAEGLVQRYPHHDDHIHVRLCEADHARGIYVCPGLRNLTAGVDGPDAAVDTPTIPEPNAWGFGG